MLPIRFSEGPPNGYGAAYILSKSKAFRFVEEFEGLACRENLYKCHLTQLALLYFSAVFYCRKPAVCVSEDFVLALFVKAVEVYERIKDESGWCLTISRFVWPYKSPVGLEIKPNMLLKAPGPIVESMFNWDQEEINVVNVFVLGSKPNPVVPNVVPDRIYACNGAISLMTKPKDSTELVGVISKTVIFSNARQEKMTRRQWAGCRVDRVIVTGGRYKSVEHEQEIEGELVNIGLKFDSFSYSADRYHQMVFHRRSKVRLAKEVVQRFSKAGPLSFLSELSRSRSRPETNVSGGVRSLLLAHEECPLPSRFFLIGIGARRSKGHFYDEQAVFEKHVLQDRNFLIDFNRRYPGCLIATDPVLARFLKRYE